MAVAIFFLLPARQEDLSEYWDNKAWEVHGSLTGPLARHALTYPHSVPPSLPHTHGFGRNSKDHIDFTGQSRSSPP